MAAVCRANPTITSFESVSDLFLTLPPPSRTLKATRGKLRDGLLQLFSARCRRILSNGENNCFVQWQQRGAKFESRLPDGFSFPAPLDHIDGAQVKGVLQHALKCLRTKSRASEGLEDFLAENVLRRSPEEQLVTVSRRQPRRTDHSLTRT